MVKSSITYIDQLFTKYHAQHETYLSLGYIFHLLYGWIMFTKYHAMMFQHVICTTQNENALHLPIIIGCLDCLIHIKHGSIHTPNTTYNYVSSKPIKELR
jgi:hypothetical protein